MSVMLPPGYGTNTLINIQNEYDHYEISKHRIGTYIIKKGDKIAQLVIVPIVTPEVNVVEDFDSESERGTKGFGSSGFQKS